MGLRREINKLKDEMTAWRHHLHAHPELSGQEKNTAAFIADKLQSFGLTSVPIGAHGIVATVTGRDGHNGRAIMLRADTDALPIHEKTGLPYASKTAGVMHACGHDGHTAMLLGAAKALTFLRDTFNGTVHLLFQPAEETGRGGPEMIAQGLFDKFPIDGIYGLHNVPAAPLGTMGTRTGAMLSASDGFVVTLHGRGGHASHPKKATDLMGAVAGLVQALKAGAAAHIVAGDKAMMTTTAIHTSSTATNVLPDSVQISGTFRSFDAETQRNLRRFLEKTVTRIAKQHRATADIAYECAMPLLVNTPDETMTAIRAARAVVSPLRVMTRAPQTLGTEDFAYLLQKCPGNYMAMGTGRISDFVRRDKTPQLHSATYDFNDAALTRGARYWVALVQEALPVKKAAAVHRRVK